MGISFDNSYARLPDRFHSRVLPAQVPDPKLIRVNRGLAAELGMDADWLESAEGVAMLSGNAVPEGAEPIAQAYAGHQFGNFVPQLGDGRAILLGEVLDEKGRRRDVQLKGAGRTVFSRGGDGKAALGPVLREYLVSEAMTAFGVPSTRALAAVTTGEMVRRETLLPGGILTRVAASHLRVGTFQYFAAREDVEALRRLVGEAIGRHYPESAEADNPALALLQSVISAQASLVAKWMGLGFIHGVMNTDNVAISGETIDFGPCAFMDAFHPHCVFSAIDRRGRYAWANQSKICHWNLTRLAETLLPLLAEDEDNAVSFATEALEAFAPAFKSGYLKTFESKLGLSVDKDEAKNSEFIQRTLNLMADQHVDFTLFFDQLTRVAAGHSAGELKALFDSPEAFDEWMEAWRGLTQASVLPEAMRASNPVLIPRNHRVEEAIQAAMKGDFGCFHRLSEAWSRPYEDDESFVDLQAAPLPEERVTQTFCGT